MFDVGLKLLRRITEYPAPIERLKSDLNIPQKAAAILGMMQLNESLRGNFRTIHLELNLSGASDDIASEMISGSSMLAVLYDNYNPAEKIVLTASDRTYPYSSSSGGGGAESSTGMVLTLPRLILKL